MALDFATLPKEYPRRFVPQQINLGDWAQIEPLLDELERRSINTKEALERWLLDESELFSAIFEERAVRYIRMTCQTDDPEHEKAYLYFVEQIDPKLKPRAQELEKRYVASLARQKLPKERYFVLDRRTENDVALFREENVSLETETTKLAQRYQKLCGAMTVQFEGREQTLQQMAKYLEEPDRDVRQKAWELIAERRLKDRHQLDEVYDELLSLRQQIARNAGFENYRDYAFRRLERFDYTPEDCFRFHEGVERFVVPLMRELQKRRQQEMSLKVLRPWDLAVDPQGRPPLRPFDSTKKLVEGCAAIFKRVDRELGEWFQRMADLNLLDLESRKGKAPGGYQITLTERRLPFIFMNAVGRDGDVRTLLHEAGHAFHTFSTREESLAAYRHAPTEFSEVASMSMELLGGQYLDEFYKPEDAARSRQEHLERVLTLLAWIATIDAFQHWIYTQPSHTRQQREDYWVELHKRFGGIESWEGYEEALRAQHWQRQLHLYQYPFYYIEYGIAQLGALGIWQRAQKGRQEAVQAYKRALAVGGSRPLPELFKAAGLSFDFGKETIARAAGSLRAVLTGE